MYILKLQLIASLLSFHTMTTVFSTSSRLANFREKRSSNAEDGLVPHEELKLSLPDKQEKTSYDPSSSFNNTRTSMRLLKGRIDRNQSSEKSDLRSTQLSTAQSQNRPILDQPAAKNNDLKLFLHDSPQLTQKKSQNEAPIKPIQKRILIAREQPKQQPPKQVERPHQVESVKKEQQVKKQQIKAPIYINQHDEKPIIKEQDVEESKPENENDLVMCPEGCGRKFNRKALEKHAKACKIVFMSKRKQFNSEAKRLTSKQQASLVKENKLKEKKEFGKTKGGFDKTSDNWKAASQDFRNAIKGIKLDEKGEQQGDEELKVVACEFCEKKFAEVLIDKHLENCLKKKEKEKKKATTKKR